MTTAPEPATSTAMTAAEAPPADAPPRIKLLPQGYVIDHPDQALGERLMAETLGVGDRAAMDGILRQLCAPAWRAASPTRSISASCFRW